MVKLNPTDKSLSKTRLTIICYHQNLRIVGDFKLDGIATFIGN